MELSFKVRNIVASICLATLSGMVYADDTAVNLALPTAASFYTRNLNSQSYLLAANEGDAVQGQAGVTPVTPAAKFEPPWMSGRKAHQYLGLGTVVLAGLTAMAAPSQGCDQNCPPASQQPPRQTSGTTHTRLARATAAMAVATVMTGLLYHWDDFHLEDGWKDPDNQHVMLAGAGALLMLYAVEKSAHSTVPTSHAGIAELGAAAMVVAIKLTW
jgi:hypothetical protein